MRVIFVLLFVLLNSPALLACPSHLERARQREAAMTYDHELTRRGVRVRWTHRSGRLVGEVRARTEGWVLVGFHTQPQLAGARLIMGSIDASGVARVEEHLASPPRHASRRALQGASLLTQTSVTRADGETIVRFSMPHKAHGMGRDVTPGVPHHMILAWSRSPDFSHHSYMRASVEGVKL